MSEYWYVRVGVISSLLLLFWVSAGFFDDKFTYWTFLLVFTTVMGFGHYFAGGYYQLRSFQRLGKPIRAYAWFLALSAIATTITIAFLLAGQVAMFSFISIGYFMVHGFFNEITLYERTAGVAANRWTIASVVFAASGVMFLSAGHVSSLFDAQLEYIAQSDYLIQAYLSSSTLPVVGLWIGVGSFALAVILQLIALARSELKIVHSLFTAGLLGGAGVLFYLYPPSYIHILSSLLLYHYLVWFLFYFKQFQSRGVGLRKYLLIHVVVFTPFLFLFSRDPMFSVIDIFILNSYVFLILTTVHITVSFMSEQFFKTRFLS